MNHDAYLAWLRTLDEQELIVETSLRVNHSPMPSLFWGLIDLCWSECRRRDREDGTRLCGLVRGRHPGIDLLAGRESIASREG